MEEVRLLAEASANDFDRQFFPSYHMYLARLNDVLQKLHANGFFRDISLLEPVPESQQAHLGVGFTEDEKAKMREIVNMAELVSRRLAAMAPEETHDAARRVERMCSRFHLVVRQLAVRRGAKRWLHIKDEYDVQNLLHALLLLEFDDVRAEEWTPSYAGGCSRMDFLLATESLVIEVKKTRKGLTAKELGEQLLIDIAKYREHPKCRQLVCFVYDPDAFVSNPRGVEADLAAQSRPEMNVAVFIRPRHF